MSRCGRTARQRSGPRASAAPVSTLVGCRRPRTARTAWRRRRGAGATRHQGCSTARASGHRWAVWRDDRPPRPARDVSRRASGRAQDAEAALRRRRKGYEPIRASEGWRRPPVRVPSPDRPHVYAIFTPTNCGRRVSSSSIASAPVPGPTPEVTRRPRQRSLGARPRCRTSPRCPRRSPRTGRSPWRRLQWPQDVGRSAKPNFLFSSGKEGSSQVSRGGPGPEVLVRIDPHDAQRFVERSAGASVMAENLLHGQPPLASGRGGERLLHRHHDGPPPLSCGSAAIEAMSASKSEPRYSKYPKRRPSYRKIV